MQCVSKIVVYDYIFPDLGFDLTMLIDHAQTKHNLKIAYEYTCPLPPEYDKSQTKSDFNAMVERLQPNNRNIGMWHMLL